MVLDDFVDADVSKLEALSVIDLSHLTISIIRHAESDASDASVMSCTLSSASKCLNVLCAKNPLIYRQVLPLYNKVANIYRIKYGQE